VDPPIPVPDVPGADASVRGLPRRVDLTTRQRLIVDLSAVAGLGDRLAPPEQAELLWEHWDRCAFHWFPGNHILHVSQPDYLRRMTRFMRDFMFA
jgi:hypothetical protein